MAIAYKQTGKMRIFLDVAPGLIPGGISNRMISHAQTYKDTTFRF